MFVDEIDFLQYNIDCSNNILIKDFKCLFIELYQKILSVKQDEILVQIKKHTNLRISGENLKIKEIQTSKICISGLILGLEVLGEK